MSSEFTVKECIDLISSVEEIKTFIIYRDLDTKKFRYNKCDIFNNINDLSNLLDERVYTYTYNDEDKSLTMGLSKIDELLLMKPVSYEVGDSDV